MSVTITGAGGSNPPTTLTGYTAPSAVPFTDITINDANTSDLVTITATTVGAGANAATYSVDGADPVTTITMTVAQFDAYNALGQLVFNPGLNSTKGYLQFSVAASGGTVVSTEQIKCFIAGTMIACPDCERAIETLVAGDLVLTANGEAKPVRFLGVSHVDLVASRENSPVRIPAGALADGMPSRDLLLSPEHAIMAQGVLVPASSLIGGAVVQETMDEVTYYHIQLDEHDLVIANGMPCETLLDTDDHSSFDNAAEGVVSIAYLNPCLPRMTQGPVVDSIRAAIDARLAVTA